MNLDTKSLGPSRRRALSTAGGLALASWLPRAQAQNFVPGQPIKVLVGAPAGGTQDVLTRAIAQEVRESLGPLILDNRAGASGRIAAATVKSSAPDGHTLLLGTANMMAMAASIFRSLNYNPVTDFAPIVSAARFELALMVNHAVPANTLAEFITWARAQGDRLSFASYGAGTPSHFLGEMLNQAAGLKMVHVPYRGTAPARQDLMGGAVPVFFDTVGGAIQSQSSDRVKVLATSGQTRSPLLPGLPTLVEQGYKNVVATGWFAYYAPKGTPKAVIDRLQGEFTRALQTRTVRQQLLQNGMYPSIEGPEAVLKTMRDDTAHWAAVAKATNFQATD